VSSEKIFFFPTVGLSAIFTKNTCKKIANYHI